MLLQDIFINRKEELKQIPLGISLGQSFILIAPRRYGKTTLIKKIIQNNLDKTVIYVDVMRYSYNISALTEAIIDGCLSNLGITSKFKNWLSNINLKLDIKIKIQELELEAIIDKINKKDDYSAFSEALDLPEKIAKKYDKKWLVVYDEIGELQYLNMQTIKIMRSVIQHHKHVSYLFAGSQETIMNNIFISSKGAFYRFGIIYELKELCIIDVIKFFQKNLINVNQEVIDYIVEKFNGHPYYTTNLFYRITLITQEYPDKKIGLHELKTILQELLASETHYLQDQIQKLAQGKNNLSVLKATANCDPYDTIIPKQTIYVVLKNLIRDGYIRKIQNKYQLTDPLLNLYLTDDFT